MSAPLTVFGFIARSNAGSNPFSSHTVSGIFLGTFESIAGAVSPIQQLSGKLLQVAREDRQDGIEAYRVEG